MINILKRLDWLLVASLLLMAAFSLISLYSLSYNDDKPLGVFWRQLIWFILGFGILFSLSFFDYRLFLNYRWVILTIYFLTIILLVVVLATAPIIRGTKSWFILGPLQFQPAEIAKLALILLLAKFFSYRHIEIALSRHLLISFSYFCVLAALIALQPDLGSSIVLLGIWFGIVLCSGLPRKQFLITILIFIVISGFLWQYFLRDYQKERIISFFYPNKDPLGVNYSVIQAKIAVGSAGFFGKGIAQGTQSQLGFLPEVKTDFIFAGFVEERGLFGGLFLISLYTFFLLRCLRIGQAAPDNFAKLLILGAVIMFGLQFLMNVGSNLGLVPVTGINFPFFSYGGSNLIINFAILGIIQSIAVRTKL